MSSNYRVIDKDWKNALFSFLSPVGAMAYWFGEQDTAESKQYRAFVTNIPFIGAVYSYEDEQRYMEDYMANTGLTWDQVKYPTRSMGQYYRGVGSAVNFTSRNISRLYR